MTIGVVIPLPRTGNAVDLQVDLAREAAGAGLRSAWFPQRFDHDAITIAGIAGREVPGLAVGTSVVPIFGRHPLPVAHQAQTAQAATHGNLHLGLGLGAPAFVESSLGLPYDRPIARLRDFLTILRSIFETGTADVHGEILTAAPPMPAALPGAEPPVPLLVAAMGPQALRATGELADGTLPFLAGPRALGEHIVPAVTAAAESAGRPAPRIVAAVPAVVTDRVDATRETAAAQTAFYDSIPSYQRVIELSGASRAAELVTVGDEKALAAAVQSYRDAGATEVVVTQTDIAGEPDRRRTWQALGALAP
ncbi:TIGR03564 family F420-dependent LLM class oxidoreductase [Actinomadura rugatobispora]|uniref:TIGR03564 family F420-dependent LLM class oxidoreductase n=1 Tax=Actinomadura rugatobispora TaxID=1994 RepID=A0ABW1A1Y1_9ACTN|nr:TIGR03564 family F420-dependent LLM class oxidoreductase [Actinomadura rugatobispora]